MSYTVSAVPKAPRPIASTDSSFTYRPIVPEKTLGAMELYRIDLLKRDSSLHKLKDGDVYRIVLKKWKELPVRETQYWIDEAKKLRIEAVEKKRKEVEGEMKKDWEGIPEETSNYAKFWNPNHVEPPPSTPTEHRKSKSKTSSSSRTRSSSIVDKQRASASLAHLASIQRTSSSSRSTVPKLPKSYQKDPAAYDAETNAMLSSAYHYQMNGAMGAPYPSSQGIYSGGGYIPPSTPNTAMYEQETEEMIQAFTGASSITRQPQYVNVEQGYMTQPMYHNGSVYASYPNEPMYNSTNAHGYNHQSAEHGNVYGYRSGTGMTPHSGRYGW